ncbi:hypothetical protein FQN50_004306 [Emmonsiellopsis sp. PD_5]|nr:hypothetical protein FQN50_004306 [Emmonsiellopsis sp. PD_5]
MTSSTFPDQDAYYILSFDSSDGPFSDLSLGSKTNDPSPLEIKDINSVSTENWHIFFDQGVYFLRNYEYSADWILGLEDKDEATPRMLRMPKSAVPLGMQWNLTRWEDGNTWKLTNRLLGEDRWLGVVNDKEPSMMVSIEGSHWTLMRNRGAPQVDSKLKVSFSSIESPPQTTNHPSPSKTGAASGNSPDCPASSPKISAGAIAGITVGGIALLALMQLAIFCLLKRRRNQYNSQKTLLPEYPATVPHRRQHDSQQIPLSEYPAAVQRVSDFPPQRKDQIELHQGNNQRAELSG